MKNILKKILSYKLNLGHNITKKNPLMKNYTKGVLSGTSFIDETKTLEGLKEALIKIKKCYKNKENIFLISTKKNHSKIIKRFCKKIRFYYVCKKWINGTLTNFKNVKKREFDSKNGNYINIKKKPKLFIIIDPNKNKSAFKEISKRNFKTIVITDTHIYNRKTTIIPMNDDSELSIIFFFKIIYYFLKKIKISNFYKNKGYYYFFKNFKKNIIVIKIKTKSNNYFKNNYFKYIIEKILDYKKNNITYNLKKLSNYYKEIISIISYKNIKKKNKRIKVKYIYIKINFFAYLLLKKKQILICLNF
ncbi:uS2m family ribosomal protein [Candidatus Vidania fulgoroideorum]